LSSSAIKFDTKAVRLFCITEVLTDKNLM
jgi:hypothetical protein